MGVGCEQERSLSLGPRVHEKEWISGVRCGEKGLLLAHVDRVSVVATRLQHTIIISIQRPFRTHTNHLNMNHPHWLPTKSTLGQLYAKGY
jgi:hypothetical protein